MQLGGPDAGARLEGTKDGPLSPLECYRALGLHAKLKSYEKVAAVLHRSVKAVFTACQGPRYATGRAAGRPPTLGAEETQALFAAFKSDPYGGVRAVHRTLWEEGYEMSLSSVYRLRLAADAAIKRRAVHRYADIPPQLYDMQMGYIDGVRRDVASGKVKLPKLFFQDESPGIWGLSHRFGYSAEPLFGCEKHKSRGAVGMHLWGVVDNERLRAWMHVDTHFTLRMGFNGWTKVCAFDSAGNDATTLDFMLNAHAVDAATPNLGGRRVFEVLKRGDILCWDRLGRGGTTQYPTTCHYNPKIKGAANDAGIGLQLLSPMGALTSPIEPAWLHLKVLVYSYKPPGEPLDKWGHFIRGPRNKPEFLAMLLRAVGEMNANPSLFHHFYYRRALGDDAVKRFEASPVYKDLEKQRAAAPPSQFSLAESAFKPHYVNIHAKGAPSTKAAKAKFAEYTSVWAAAGYPINNTPGPAGAAASPSSSDSDDENVPPPLRARR